MSKIKTISKVLMILIFIQLSINLVFAVSCVELINNYLLPDFESPNPNEYIIRLNRTQLENTNLNIVKINQNHTYCKNKIYVLEIYSPVNFIISGNKKTQYINGVDILRIKKDVNFTVANEDGLGITTVDLNVGKVEIDGNVELLLTDNDKRAKGGNTLKLKINNLLVKEESKLQLKILGDSLPERTIHNPNHDNNLNGTNVWLKVNTIENNGDLFIDLNGGNGGAHKTPFTLWFGYSGGSVYDLNISRFINKGTFKYQATGGRMGFNRRKRNNPKAGDVGSVNIDYLYNAIPDFSIRTEINEKNVNNLSSVNCGCSLDDCANTTDPKIGDIEIKYLASGSYLPKKLEIIKNAVYSSYTTININGCHAASSGNSNISYKADDLVLQLANLGIIQNDFDNDNCLIGNIYTSETTCPVCDSLELNNFALRTDTEYTIYTDNAGVITDLNIYYVNPDGSLFKPPGYPSDENYVVYSLKTGENIMPDSKQFAGTNIKEYKIAKDILHYNPENFDLTNIPEEKGYGIDDVRLFCQAQRYLLKFKLQNDVVIKEIYFTPLFNIK